MTPSSSPLPLQAQRKANPGPRAGTGGRRNEPEPQRCGFVFISNAAPTSARFPRSGRVRASPNPTTVTRSPSCSSGTREPRKQRSSSCPGRLREPSRDGQGPGRCPWQHRLPRAPSCPSPPLHKLLRHGVGVQAPPASAQGRVPDLQIGSTAVDVVFCEGGDPGDVVRVEDIGFLPGLA